MKTRNVNLKALILTLVLMIAGQSFAHKYYTPVDGKKIVKVNLNTELVEFISQALDISEEELVIIKNRINNTDFYMTDSNSGHLAIYFDYHNESTDLEDWMFEDDYLTSSEASPEIEAWMYEEEYLNTEAKPAIEDWMFEDDYFDVEATPEIEAWMFEADYLGSTESIPQIEDWMMDDNYYITETAPQVEDWMLDLTYFQQ